MIHHLIQGTEEDCRMLMSDCQVNVKKENVEQKKEARQCMERSNNEEAAVVQLDLSLDAYLPPGPRQADTLVMASRRFAQTPVLMTFLFLFCERCESDDQKPKPGDLGGEWGGGQISQSKWEVEDVEDKLGAIILQVDNINLLGVYLLL